MNGVSGRRVAVLTLEERIVGEAVEEGGFLRNLENRVFNRGDVRTRERVEV